MEEKTISVARLNLFGLLFFVASTPFILFLYHFVNGVDIKVLFDDSIQIIYFVLIFLLSILIHELIHATVFAFFAKKRWKSIKIGVFWKHITPYTHCSEPLSKRAYTLALISPGIILGIIPICYAFISAHLLLLIYGLIMLFAALGDFMIFVMLLKVPTGKKIIDHNSKVGFWIVDAEN